MQIRWYPRIKLKINSEAEQAPNGDYDSAHNIKKGATAELFIQVPAFAWVLS